MVLYDFMGGVEKNQETFTVFLSKEVVQGILLLCRLSVIFCYKNEKSHQKGAFWPAHNGYYCFLRSIYICFDDLFMKRFILGYVVINAHVMNWKKNFFKLNEDWWKISSNRKSREIRKLLQKYLNPLWCIVSRWQAMAQSVSLNHHRSR